MAPFARPHTRFGFAFPLAPRTREAFIVPRAVVAAEDVAASQHATRRASFPGAANRRNGSVPNLAGTQIGKYDMIEEVGHGGMAVVYRGLDRVLKREVAVKVLHPHLADRAESRARLEREAIAVAKLRHENILEIFDYSGTEADASYIVTEFIHGVTLKQWVDERLEPRPAVAALIVHRLCQALQHAHRSGIVHRDIKPENVMIREDGVLKLMDFGIAQLILDDQKLTLTGQLIGSPAYTSIVERFEHPITVSALCCLLGAAGPITGEATAVASCAAAGVMASKLKATNAAREVDPTSSSRRDQTLEESPLRSPIIDLPAGKINALCATARCRYPDSSLLRPRRTNLPAPRHVAVHEPEERAACAIT